MKKIRKMLCTTLILCFMFSQVVMNGDATVEAASGTWKKDSKGWYYVYSKGSYAKNKWVQEGKKWYYFDAQGYMVTGWKQIAKKWYFFDAHGCMMTGWKKSGGQWYYLNSSGVMQTGWKQISGEWYFFNSSGIMQKGWKKISGYWYYFNQGAMVTGYRTIGGKDYVFYEDGPLVTDKIFFLDNTVYILDDGSVSAHAEVNGDLVFAVESVKFNKGNLVVTGYYVNTNDTDTIASVTSLDLEVYDAYGDLVTSVTVTVNKSLYLQPGYYRTIPETITIENYLIEKTNADLSSWSYYNSFNGITYYR